MDKSQMLVDGVPMVQRLIQEFEKLGWPVTVVGQFPVSGADFVRDSTPNAGPLSALRDFIPQRPLVFVASCDLVLFRCELARFFESNLGESDAVIPVVDGRAQPLCALYRASSIERLKHHPDLERVLGWVDLLQVSYLSEADLRDAGMSPSWTRGANTPEEVQKLMSQR